MHPVALACPRVEPGRLVFSAGGREVVVEGDAHALVRALEACDGERALEDFEPSVRAALIGLVEHGLVADRSQTYRRGHAEGNLAAVRRTGAAPATPPPAWSPAAGATSSSLAAAGGALPDLLARRRSARPGARSRPLGAAELGTVLQAAYGLNGPERRTVPSAGALYPLIVHVALRAPAGELAPGLWVYDPPAARLRLVDAGRGDARALFVVRPEVAPVLEAAPALILVSADVARVAAVYGARAYRYALIEAGAALQNATLAATELELACCPLGLFDDEATAAFLELGDGVLPLLGITVG